MIVASTNAAMLTNDKNTPLLTIATAAKLLGVSVGTLRLYDRKGLILVHKTSGNQRLYSESDVERLRCIRTAITEHKISIEGIRYMHSMIPCWEFVRCQEKERQACPAYNSPKAGCWSYPHEDNACGKRTCRECPVYRLSCDCTTIKQLVYHTFAPSKTRHPKGKKETHT
jgi:excisionase family DNA binding protein